LRYFHLMVRQRASYGYTQAYELKRMASYHFSPD
jgi:hypothetical protein